MSLLGRSSVMACHVGCKLHSLAIPPMVLVSTNHGSGGCCWFQHGPTTPTTMAISRGIATGSTSSNSNSSMTAAHRLLGLTQPPTSFKELRYAYYQAAKTCHPDAQRHANPNSNNTNKSTTPNDNKTTNQKFVELVEAYELLQQHVTELENDSWWTCKDRTDGSSSSSSSSVEEEFCRACETQLGLSGELVEECKGNPLFLQWLAGNTDAAQLWNTFLDLHGGLAPVLRSSSTTTAWLTAGGGDSAAMHTNQTTTIATRSGTASTPHKKQQPRRKRPPR